MNNPITGRRLARLDTIATARTSASDPGHDILHVRRVVSNARRIADAEGADREIVEIAALLHELFNYPKDHPESAHSGEVCAEQAAEVLKQEEFASDTIDAVVYAIRVHPFSLGIVPVTLEAKVLQDADRLDALGAIGIARVFSTSSTLGRPFYSADDPFCTERAPDDRQFTLDHFYRKLLRLPDTMHTATGRRIGEERAAFLRVYLTQFGRELSGEG